MPRQAKPWWHSQKGEWYCKHRGKFTPLGVTEKTATKAAWNAFYRLKGASINAPATTVDGAHTVVGLLARFLTWCKKNRKPLTYSWYRQILTSFIKSIEPTLAIDELKAHHVTSWVADQSEWKSNDTQRNAMCAVKRAIRWAYDEELIDVLPIRKLDLPRRKPRDVTIAPEVWSKIIKAASGPFRDLLEFSSETMCRPQESRTILSAWLSADGQTIVIPAPEAKGQRKARVIYLTPLAKRIAKRLAKKWPNGEMFRNTRGEPWTRNAIRCTFRRLREKLEINDRLFATAIRHTAITDALENQVPLPYVAELAGHDPKTAMGVYGHLDQRKGELLEAAKKARVKKKVRAKKEKGKTKAKN